jgi:hypothetical protein
MSFALALMVTLLGCRPVDNAPEGKNTPPCTQAHLQASYVTHVRSTDDGLRETLRNGCAVSSTFRTLVDALQATSTIVYIEHGICGFGHFKACLPHTITVVGDTRILRIVIDVGVRDTQRLSLIGHELQHGLEIARAPNIRSSEDVTALFRRIGRSPHCPLGTPDCYETSEAVAAGNAVLREVERSQHARDYAVGLKFAVSGCDVKLNQVPAVRNPAQVVQARMSHACSSTEISGVRPSSETCKRSINGQIAEETRKGKSQSTYSGASD